MRQDGRPGGLILAMLFSLVLAGCDGTPPASSSAEQAKVKGTFTLKGKPLAKVEVRFNPSNINRKSAPTATAATGDDGSYEVTTLVGENTISLGGAVVGQYSKELAYFNKSFQVNAGENMLDLTVP